MIHLRTLQQVPLRTYERISPNIYHLPLLYHDRGEVIKILWTPMQLQAISKKPFGPISLLEAKFKSSEYLSMLPV
jgi:hypothetical protein